MFPPNGNHSTDADCKSANWFLYVWKIALKYMKISSSFPQFSGQYRKRIQNPVEHLKLTDFRDLTWNYSFSTYAKFSEKLTFLIP